MRRKNLLFIVPDQLRGDWVGFREKYPVRTPNIDRLAARGTTFSQAWTPSPLCAPARACMVTMKEYDRNPVKNNYENLDPAASTYFKLLRDSGYRVASTGKMDLLKGAMSWGYDGRHRVEGDSLFEKIGLTDGFDSAGKHNAIKAYEKNIPEPYLKFLSDQDLAQTHVDDYEQRVLIFPEVPVGELMADYSEPCASYLNDRPTELPPEAYCDSWIGRRSIDALKGMEGDAPWFLMINFVGPHEPMDVTHSMSERWNNVQFDPPIGLENKDPNTQLRIRQNYAAMIENIDDWVGKLTDYLEETGQMDDTIIVFSSDHGEMLGDSGLYGKEVPYEASVAVPLVISGPDVRRGVDVSHPVSLLDVVATFVDYAGLELPDDADGVSLRAVLENESARAPREYAISGLGGWRTITDGRFKLIAGFDKRVNLCDMQHIDWPGVTNDSTELYDLESDPHELNDLSGQRPDIVTGLLDELFKQTKLGPEPSTKKLQPSE